MKKIIVLIVAMMVVVINASAQRSNQRHIVSGQLGNSSMANARTTGTGDTVTMSNTGTAALVLYGAGADSGYLTGTNYWGDKAFAERYDLYGGDSTVKVIGALARFGGAVSSSSTKSISLNIWGVGNQQYIASGLYYSGRPTVVVDSQVVPFTELGVGTMKQFMFTTPSAFLAGSFFFGYSVNYNFTALGGDTIGLFSSAHGSRTSPAILIDTVITDIDTLVDTIINVQNATQWSDGTWHDNYTDNDSLFNDLAIYPVVMVWHPMSAPGITRKDLTFYGTYPNPASDRANVKLSLAKTTGITIQVMDVSGRVVTEMLQANLVPGEHIIEVNTSGLPAGEYIYLIRTSGGDGIASKMIIVR